MELVSRYPQSQRLLQPGHRDLAAHPPLGLTRARFWSSLTAQGKEGHGGKSLKEHLMVTSFKTHQTLDVQELRCRGRKS